MVQANTVTVSLIVLTLNEIDGMKTIMPQVDQGCVNEILVVDGGSTDGTVEEAKHQGLQVIRQEHPGRGEAFREGLRHTKGDILVFFSPDGNEDPQDIPVLVNKLTEGFDMVIASRFGPGFHSDDAGLVTRLGNRAFTIAINRLFGARVSDAVNGFRAITRDCMEALKTRAVHFEIEIEMTMKASRKGYSIGEIPTIERRRIGGRPKLNKVVDGIRYTRFVLEEFRDRSG